LKAGHKKITNYLVEFLHFELSFLTIDILVGKGVNDDDDDDIKSQL